MIITSPRNISIDKIRFESVLCAASIAISLVNKDTNSNGFYAVLNLLLPVLAVWLLLNWKIDLGVSELAISILIFEKL